MWDLPRPGLEPVSPALAGRFSTTAPPEKPYITFLKSEILDTVYLDIRYYLSRYIFMLDTIDLAFIGNL